MSWTNSWRERARLPGPSQPLGQRGVVSPRGDLGVPPDADTARRAAELGLKAIEKAEAAAEPKIAVRVIEASFSLGPGEPLPVARAVYVVPLSQARNLVARGKVEFVGGDPRTHDHRERAARLKAEVRERAAAAQAPAPPPPPLVPPPLPADPLLRATVRTVRPHVGPGSVVMEVGDVYETTLEDAAQRAVGKRPQIEILEDGKA